jgi:hypothetical protein
VAQLKGPVGAAGHHEEHARQRQEQPGGGPRAGEHAHRQQRPGRGAQAAKLHAAPDQQVDRRQQAARQQRQEAQLHVHAQQVAQHDGGGVAQVGAAAGNEVAAVAAQPVATGQGLGPRQGSLQGHAAGAVAHALEQAAQGGADEAPAGDGGQQVKAQQQPFARQCLHQAEAEGGTADAPARQGQAPQGIVPADQTGQGLAALGHHLVDRVAHRIPFATAA